MPCRSTVRNKLILKIHGTVFEEFVHAANWTIHWVEAFTLCSLWWDSVWDSPIYYCTTFQFEFFITRILQWHYGERLNSKRYGEFSSCGAAGSWSLGIYLPHNWLDSLGVAGPLLWNCMAVLLYTLRSLKVENYNGTTERRILWNHC